MLHDTQQKFLEGIFSEEYPEILSSVANVGDFSPEQRFQVYQNNAKLILTDILKRLYPVVMALVGEDFFRYLAFSYIKAEPPKTCDMTFYGDSFGQFLKSFAPLKDLNYMSDVADMEWAWYKSGMAGRKTALTAEFLADITEDNIPELKFNFQPSVLLLDSTYAVDKIWQAVTDNETEQLSDIKLEQDTYLIIYCPSDKDVTFLSVDKPTYSFVKALYNGNNLNLALEQAIAIDADFIPDQHIAYFITNSMFTVNE